MSAQAIEKQTQYKETIDSSELVDTQQVRGVISHLHVGDILPRTIHSPKPRTKRIDRWLGNYLSIGLLVVHCLPAPFTVKFMAEFVNSPYFKKILWQFLMGLSGILNMFITHLGEFSQPLKQKLNGYLVFEISVLILNQIGGSYSLLYGFLFLKLYTLWRQS